MSERANTETTRTPRKKTTSAKTQKPRTVSRTATKKWSQDVTEHSDAMTLEAGVFKQTSARKIAASLKHSAETSDRRKSTPFRSAMSMLNFYINRAGDTLSAAQRRRLDAAKDELRALFKRPARPSTGH